MSSNWVLVTGAARRIGRVIAIDLAESGWNVVVHFNHSQREAEGLAKEIKGMGRKAHLVQADFTDKRQTESFIDDVVAETGTLAALVNNASLFEPDSQVPGGHDHKAVNVEAPLMISEAFRKHLPRGSKGAIVNLLDGTAPELGFTAYTESKKSLRILTIEMARRFAPNVRVNGVAPGPILRGVRQSAEHFRHQIDMTLLKTEITPLSVAHAVRFMIDNPSMTGEILHIDGGIRLKNTPFMMRTSAG